MYFPVLLEPELAVPIQAAVKEAGINLRVETVTKAKQDELILTNAHEVLVVRWVAVDPSVLGILFFSHNIPGPGKFKFNWAHFGSPELDRMLWTGPVLLVATTLAFLVLHLIPGDPVNLMLAGRPASETVRQNLRRNLGLDRPIHEQYVHFVVRAVRGDFGISFRTREPVIEEIARQLPATLELATAGMLIGVSVGMMLGLIAGLRPNTYLDG